MSIKSILLHLTRDKRNEARIDAAVTLASRTGAHLIGLYTIPTTQMPTSFMGYVPAEYIETVAREEREHSEKVRELFEERAGGNDFSVEWRVVEGFAPDAVAFQSHYSDVLVVGQTNPDGEPSVPANLVDELVIGAGSSVLVIPYAGKFTNFGKTVLVAWNGTRESARAVKDSLPFLEKADKVLVVAVNAASEQHIPGADIATHLARHGVKAEVHNMVTEDISVADALLGALSDYGCDMLVMGAYGHSRVRELVLGGATHQILNQMTVPVLMSH